MKAHERLAELIKSSHHAVFFGGAGVSTSSGIPDFRSAHGLYSEDVDGAPAEAMLHIDCLNLMPASFFKYYRSHMLYPDAKPNGAHIALAGLEAAGKLHAVVTQNIDGLHQLAGSKNVIELHGSVLHNHCTLCGRRYGLDAILATSGVPRCKCERDTLGECRGVIRPDVVLYGEALPAGAFERAEDEISAADLLIVGGTSLSVYPAAGLAEDFTGEHLVIINQSPTHLDSYAELVIRENIAEVLASAVELALAAQNSGD